MTSLTWRKVAGQYRAGEFVITYSHSASPRYRLERHGEVIWHGHSRAAVLSLAEKVWAKEQVDTARALVLLGHPAWPAAEDWWL